MENKKLLGRRGEQSAAKYLSRKGYRIIGLNYSCRLGEIDIIAEDARYIVFAEVKRRRSAAFAEAREYVTAAKQRRIIATASLWLSQNPTDRQPRFDVLEVYASGDGAERINHIENAYEV